jgi:hypothetical protein
MVVWWKLVWCFILSTEYLRFADKRNLYYLIMKSRSKLILFLLSAFNDFELQSYKASLSQ